MNDLTKFGLDPHEIDEIDARLLDALQADAKAPLAKLGELTPQSW